MEGKIPTREKGKKENLAFVGSLSEWLPIAGAGPSLSQDARPSSFYCFSRHSSRGLDCKQSSQDLNQLKWNKELHEAA